MKLKIKIHPNSSQEKIEEIGDGNFEVWIKEKAEKNKANEELVRILKKYFGKPVKIIKGFKSKKKIVEIK